MAEFNKKKHKSLGGLKETTGTRERNEVGKRTNKVRAQQSAKDKPLSAKMSRVVQRPPASPYNGHSRYKMAAWQYELFGRVRTRLSEKFANTDRNFSKMVLKTPRKLFNLLCKIVFSKFVKRANNIFDRNEDFNDETSRYYKPLSEASEEAVFLMDSPRGEEKLASILFSWYHANPDSYPFHFLKLQVHITARTVKILRTNILQGEEYEDPPSKEGTIEVFRPTSTINGNNGSATNTDDHGKGKKTGGNKPKNAKEKMVTITQKEYQSLTAKKTNDCKRKCGSALSPNGLNILRAGKGAEMTQLPNLANGLASTMESATIVATVTVGGDADWIPIFITPVQCKDLPSIIVGRTDGVVDNTATPTVPLFSQSKWGTEINITGNQWTNAYDKYYFSGLSNSVTDIASNPQVSPPIEGTVVMMRITIRYVGRNDSVSGQYYMYVDPIHDNNGRITPSEVPSFNHVRRPRIQGPAQTMTITPSRPKEFSFQQYQDTGLDATGPMSAGMWFSPNTSVATTVDGTSYRQPGAPGLIIIKPADTSVTDTFELEATVYVQSTGRGEAHVQRISSNSAEAQLVFSVLENANDRKSEESWGSNIARAMYSMLGQANVFLKTDMGKEMIKSALNLVGLPSHEPPAPLAIRDEL